MNLHEYQAKELFSEYQIPVPYGVVISDVKEAAAAAGKLKTKNWVVKAQVHAGGRGKAGGVKIVSTMDELNKTVENLLGKNLVTYQTDEHGQPIHKLLIEETCNIGRELYLGAVVDRSLRRVVFMASTEGGVEIEKIAESHPEKILKIIVDPLVGVLPYQGRDLGFALGLTADEVKQFSQILVNLGKLFVDLDLSLLEVNPLVVTKEGKLICLDGKINTDDNATYRQPKLREMHDPTQENDRENKAHEWELNYIPLDGDIGCMVNGAGLAMATMDLIKLHGGNPANFLDVGGGATQERVTEAFKIILADPKVKGILVNIFGGIVRCDMIADGIINAVQEVGIKIPVVVRLEGNNSDLGIQKLEAPELKAKGLNINAAVSLTDAAEKIVKAVRLA